MSTDLLQLARFWLRTGWEWTKERDNELMERLHNIYAIDIDLSPTQFRLLQGKILALWKPCQPLSKCAVHCSEDCKEPVTMNYTY